MLQLKSKSYDFSKLLNLALRQAQAAASIETTNTQPSHEEQPEPTLVYSPHSWQTADEFLPLLLTTNAIREKDKFPKVKEKMKLPSLLLVRKAIRGKNKTLKFMTIHIPSDY